MTKLEIIIRALDEKLAKDLVAIDMSLNSAYYDTFVICTSMNENMMRALKDNVVDKCEEQGYFYRNIEGLHHSTWMLIDYGDIIIHIFDKDERDNYKMEKLWADMPRIDISEYIDE